MRPVTFLVYLLITVWPLMPKRHPRTRLPTTRVLPAWNAPNGSSSPPLAHKVSRPAADLLAGPELLNIHPNISPPGRASASAMACGLPESRAATQSRLVSVQHGGKTRGISVRKGSPLGGASGT